MSSRGGKPMKKYVLRGAVLGAVILMTMFQDEMTPSGVIMLLVIGLVLGSCVGWVLGVIREADENAGDEPEREDVREDVRV
jgi:membrane protein YqaA with SNARE-associated domain